MPPPVLLVCVVLRAIRSQRNHQVPGCLSRAPAPASEHSSCLPLTLVLPAPGRTRGYLPCLYSYSSTHRLPPADRLLSPAACSSCRAFLPLASTACLLAIRLLRLPGSAQAPVSCCAAPRRALHACLRRSYPSCLPAYCLLASGRSCRMISCCLLLEEAVGWSLSAASLRSCAWVSSQASTSSETSPSKHPVAPVPAGLPSVPSGFSSPALITPQ